MFYHDLKVAGYSDCNGKRFISASYEGRTAIIPHAMCYGKAEDVLPALADRGLVIPGPSAAKTLLERIYRITEFEAANVIATPGYANGQFTLGDGSVISKDTRRPMIAFAADPMIFGEAGTIKSWQREIARHIAGQPIPMMAMLLAFAAPLAAITGTPICHSIEFVGLASSGVDVLPYLLASVCGAPARQVTQFARVARSDESVSFYHNDLALAVIGSDVCLAGETAGRRALAVKNYLFPSHSGAGEISRNRCMVSFSHEALLSQADAATELAPLAAGKHVSIRVPGERKYGIFEGLPSTCPNSSALAKRLVNRAHQHHGVPLRRFLDHLVEMSSIDLTELNRVVSKRLEAFRKAAADDRNDQCEAIVTDTFAIAYAAGWIARHIGILPPTWPVNVAVMRCYRHYRHQAAPPRSFIDILREIAAGDDVVQIGGSESQTGSFEGTNVFVKNLGRRIEIMIRPDAIHALLPDWNRWLGRSAAKNMMVTEKGRLTVKRSLGEGTKERVHCFRIPSSSRVGQ
ncbi:DUF927 domain-containing protein [uncultured Sphingomonas sp.]|uniref:DUF927 domain-containing protein n=1 Tax=uncultured Sphingomonas sp. TaxID=158754 RepID=UPI0025FFCDA5|nr:DUF927 domain-containing protein [uncultured Sphingomonas sp.]